MNACTYCQLPLTDFQRKRGFKCCSKSCGVKARSSRARGLVCAVEGCGGDIKGRGYCDKHLQRIRRNGTLEVPPYVEMTEEARFWSKVDLTGPCWLWVGAVNNHGYGIFSTWIGGQKKYLAHRYALRMLGLLDESLVVIHACDTPRCVNPEHLGQGTQGDNLRDAARKGRIRNQFGAQKIVDGLTKAERAA